MTANQAPSSSTIIGALGNLVGYIGAEAATVDIFERLLWPQRFYNNFNVSNAPIVILLMPMMGPLHSAALATLDRFSRQGLCRGRRSGHMLDTAFFSDSKIKYKILDGSKEPTKECRNGIWPRAIAQILPSVEVAHQIVSDKENKNNGPVRSLAAACNLSLRPMKDCETPKPLTIKGDVGRVTWRIYLGLFVSETISLTIGIIAATVWRSYFAFLWLVPLLLKLTSGVLAVSREGLASPDAAVRNNIVARCDLPNNRALIIDGPEATVLQFFRHYGHPVRNRFLEIAQITIIVAFALVFPAGFIMSTIWMPTGLQYVWLGHQIYNTFALYVYRYTSARDTATTEQRIAKLFQSKLTENKRCTIYLGCQPGETVAATLQMSFHNRWRSAQEAAEKALSNASATQSDMAL